MTECLPPSCPPRTGPRETQRAPLGPSSPFGTDKLPSGSQRLHEIKHDRFRIIARKNGAQVRLYSRRVTGR